ncbi:hypothetical protein [Arcobacter sp. s6]|uniref:hypothetical protein n=1 Tax=Arcobacter sp. s6 TaxID=3230363 RepID=UPI00349FD8E3
MKKLPKMDYDSHIGISGVLFPQLLNSLNRKNKYVISKASIDLIYSNASKFFDKNEEIIILLKKAKINKTNLRNITLLKEIFNLFKEYFILLNEIDERMYKLEIFTNKF